MHTNWQPMALNDVVARFAPHDVDWWVAGGHAIDLFLGWESRPHDDLDLEIFRTDASRLFTVFDGWDFAAVAESGSQPVSVGDELKDDVYAVWIRPSPSDPWAAEVMFADGDASEWRFRRDNSIVMEGGRHVRNPPDGLPYGAPEIQLLYKATQHRPKDDADLVRTLHLMSGEQKDWLRAAVARLEREHPWIPVLQNSAKGHHE
jgi:hypothetical protein